MRPNKAKRCPAPALERAERPSSRGRFRPRETAFTGGEGGRCMTRAAANSANHGRDGRRGEAWQGQDKARKRKKSGVEKKPHLHRKERRAVDPCSESDPRLRVNPREKKQARHSRHRLLRLSTLFHAEEGSFRFLANEYPDDCFRFHPGKKALRIVAKKLRISAENRLAAAGAEMVRVRIGVL
jgi:hypothetical protein